MQSADRSGRVHSFYKRCILLMLTAFRGDYMELTSKLKRMMKLSKGKFR